MYLSTIPSYEPEDEKKAGKPKKEDAEPVDDLTGFSEFLDME